MPRTLNVTLQAKLTAGSTNLCHLLTITRKDGEIFRYTDLDIDLVVDGQTYESSDSFAVTAITSSASNGIQSTNCNIIFSVDGFTEAETAQGAYDSAHAEFAAIDYIHPEWGKMILLTGRMAAINATNRKIGQFEMNGLLSIGDAKIGEVYSPECRANLGDARCKIDTSLFNQTGHVNHIDIPANFRSSIFRVIFDAVDPINGLFNQGIISFTSGNNNGLTVEVQAQFHADALFYGALTHDIFVAVPLPKPVQVGDTFRIVNGCDKRPITCLTKFNNIVNFRGEPFVPGSDYINDLKLL